MTVSDSLLKRSCQHWVKSSEGSRAVAQRGAVRTEGNGGLKVACAFHRQRGCVRERHGDGAGAGGG